jgi:peptidoglycan/LPS O-acetylase OafA/YrhL
LTTGTRAAPSGGIAEPRPHPPRSSSALGHYNPGLDGLRAVAVAAVLCFHGGFSWAVGGYLGVSTFFTLSGFLIMSLLLRSAESPGGPNLRTFWSNRFRRLLPAALLALCVVWVFAATVASAAQLRVLPGQVLGCLTYVVNWVFVATRTSYADLFAAPSPVQHFWSLAVEEQLYLVIPLTLWLLLRWTRSLKAIGLVFGALVAASVVEMLLLHRSGASADRLYYGTDTRSAEVFVGVVLAVVVRRHPMRQGRFTSFVLPVLGVVALGGAAWPGPASRFRARHSGVAGCSRTPWPRPRSS